MEPPPFPPQPPSHLTGSRGMDILLGMAAAVGWWVAAVGVPAALTGTRILGVYGLFVPFSLLGLFVAFLAAVIVLARRPGPKTFLITMIITTFGVPLLAILAVVGMCSGMFR